VRVTPLVVLTAVATLVLAACGGPARLAAPPAGADQVSASVVVAPGGSIQAAIDAAVPGAVIQISPGTYHEALTVAKAGIKLIGRGDVTIENPGDAENGIRVSDAGDGFVLFNVTVRGFEENGVLLVRVNGFLLSNVRTVDNGEYGLFPSCPPMA